MVDSFLLENPEISVELTLDDRVVNLVEEGFDVAIRIRALADSSLTARRLATARMALCAAPAYLARRAAPRHPRDLARHDCLVYDYMARQGVWCFTREGAAEDVRVGGRLHGNNGDVLVQAAVDGLGVVMTPTFIAHEAIRSGALVPILQDWRAVEPGLYAVMPPGRVDALKVRVLAPRRPSPLAGEGLFLTRSRRSQGAVSPTMPMVGI